MTNPLRNLQVLVAVSGNFSPFKKYPLVFVALVQPLPELPEWAVLRWVLSGTAYNFKYWFQ